ncbi:hypothetical protein RND81_12G035400 [Saponaria officinalis]|uniref:CCHC-type domain-containing protein n=1 Tax=Saponaria officinalis TaxID=3572 RepID=A0AAW1H684_SAPOF
MSNLAKLDFVALDITGKNYLQWVSDAEIHLSPNEKAKAMIFLHHHLNEGLKYEYLTVKDPLTLWTNLKERYDHLKTVILPKARYDWIHLRRHDFTSISDYNSVMFRITSQLSLCGENVSDSDIGFKKYSELIYCLLVAEQNNEILLKNHQSCPTEFDPFPEVNAIKYDHKNKGPYHASSRGRGRGYTGRGNNFGNYRGCRGGQFKMSYSHQKWEQNNGPRDKDKINADNFCNSCGCKGHWSRTCRTRKYFVDLYQQSLKDKYNYGGFLNVSDFLSDPDGRIDYLIGDGSVQKQD